MAKEFKGRYDKLIDALFDAYCDENNDYPQDIKDTLNDTIKHFSDALHTTPAKIDNKFMVPICEIERWAFEQGFATCLELLGNSLLRRKNYEQNKS